MERQTEPTLCSKMHFYFSCRSGLWKTSTDTPSRNLSPSPCVLYPLMWFWPLNRLDSADQKVNDARALKHNGCVMQFNGRILGPMICNLRCLNWALLHFFFFLSLRLLRTRGLLPCRLIINMLEIWCWCKIRKLAQWPFVGTDAQLCDKAMC